MPGDSAATTPGPQTAPAPSRPAAGRGALRVYLAAAPGAGKTYAMLNEGHRFAERGGDVVVGYVETHNRPRTAERVVGLEVIPRRTLEYRGTTFEEMDVDAILARRPQRVLVDELAHTNVPGSRNPKRWQDVQDLLDAGITVISTVNIQHLESLNDVVEQITGVVQRETIPDHVVRSAEQVELIDQTPEALRQRMAHGNIYGPDKIDAALTHYFRVGNLGALRELALLWLADKVDESLAEYRRRHGIDQPWETRERVIVAVTGGPAGEHLIRRAARIAQRARGDLIGVHVQADDGLSGPVSRRLDDDRKLLRELGGELRVVTGADVAASLAELARTENATQIVLGASGRSRWQELIQGSVINRVIRLSGPIDAHVISPRTKLATPVRPWWGARHRPPAALPPRRRLGAISLAAVGLPALTVVLTGLRDTLSLPSVLLLYLVAVLGIGAVGGSAPAIVAAVAAFLLANWYFTPPFYRFTIGERENLLALVIFLLAATLVSYFVDLAARRRHELAQVRSEAEAMARMAGSLTAEQMLPSLVDQVRSTFAVTSAVVFRRHLDDGSDRQSGTGPWTGGGAGAGGTWAATEDRNGPASAWDVEVTSGQPAPDRPHEADAIWALGPDRVLALRGGHLRAVDHRLISALTAQATLVLEARRLQSEAARAVELARANDLRTGLLQAVTHDLRTPLASIKASISSLRRSEIAWNDDQVEEFETIIEEETDRLAGLIDSLLEMSSLQAGVIAPHLRETCLDEVIPQSLASLGHRAREVVVELPPDLPTVVADPVVLGRVVANLVDNALNASTSSIGSEASSDANPAVLASDTHPGGGYRTQFRRVADPSTGGGGPPCRIQAGAVAGRVLLRIVDQGVGIGPERREDVFVPFQRLVDHGTGVGLGLAIARGLTDAMNGELSIEDTPGGGTTMVVSLPQFEPDADASESAPDQSTSTVDRNPRPHPSSS